MTPWTEAYQSPLSMGILQVRILEWVAMPSSRECSQHRNQTQVSFIAGNSLPSQPSFKWSQVIIFQILAYKQLYRFLTWISSPNIYQRLTFSPCEGLAVLLVLFVLGVDNMVVLKERSLSFSITWNITWKDRHKRVHSIYFHYMKLQKWQIFSRWWKHIHVCL